MATPGGNHSGVMEIRRRALVGVPVPCYAGRPCSTVADRPMAPPSDWLAWEFWAEAAHPFWEPLSLQAETATLRHKSRSREMSSMTEHPTEQPSEDSLRKAMELAWQDHHHARVLL
jgi:hypothetical protein